MAGQLDDGVLNDIINSNFKVVAGAAVVGLSQSLSLAAQDALSHQRIINGIREAAFAETVLQRAGVDISEAISAKKIGETDLSRTLAELANTVAAIQQTMKGAQTTRPETGGG